MLGEPQEAGLASCWAFEKAPTLTLTLAPTLNLALALTLALALAPALALTRWAAHGGFRHAAPA